MGCGGKCSDTYGHGGVLRSLLWRVVRGEGAGLCRWYIHSVFESSNKVSLIFCDANRLVFLVYVIHVFLTSP